MGYTREDYTVAWICALPLEMTAAKLMLDKLHPSLPQPKTDHNTYTLGCVGGHNVVLACLPSGVYGTTSAAIVLAHMLSTFPSLRFGLMVGIGGGVPSKTADIRLGDVVVSMPTASSGGVIQYDYGKTLRDGSFQRTGSLNKPPQYLLTAVSQIRSDVTEDYMERTLTEVLQKDENIKEQFSRPGNDWLFEATYDHETEKTNCLKCDHTQLVDRPPRKCGSLFIHYGLIASGNQVMKNAQIRDSIAQQIGILCFEMEAAGLMDQLPCLVIRGICDYCDSHKHKEWQGYAALTAATYAAHILHAVPKTEITSLRAQKVEFTEEEKACLRSLFITNPIEDKNSLKRRKGDRAFGTCSWIFGTEELRHWLGLSTHNDQEERSILWLYGNPGTGKSTMAITLAEELPSKPYFRDGNKTIAYFFCDSSSDVNRTAIAVLRGLLYQLIKQHPTLMQYLLPRYNERTNKIFSSFDALWAVIIDVAKYSEDMEFHYIIDALDECEPDSQAILLEQIHQTFGNLNLRGSAPSNIHILITSRPYHEIRGSLSTFPCKDLATYDAVASDLRKVIQEKVKVLSKRNRYPRPLIADVSRVLEEKAEGTFLWVGIACDELAQIQSRNALKSLQALPRGLNSLYKKLLETAITTSNQDDRPTILEILGFVAFALRPLTLAELSEACNLYPNEEEDIRLQFTQEVIDLCRLMIVVQGRHVRLLHKSVKDFLSRETQNIDSILTHARMAYRCISTVIHRHNLKSPGELLNDRNGFLNYSTVCWPQHASLSRNEFTVRREHESFFLLVSNSWNTWRCLYNSLQASFFNRLDEGFLSLHAAARWGIPQLIQFATNDPKAYVDHPEQAQRRKLLVDSDFKTYKGVTPLAEAARNGQILIMRTLLERGPRSQPISENVMKAAARNIIHGDKVVLLLLEHHEDQIQITDDIIKLVSRNHFKGKQIMKLLLERCVDQVKSNTHLISTIIEAFDVSIVKSLLIQCGEEFQLSEGIIEAAARGYLHGNEIMILMLDRHREQIRDNPRLVTTIIQNFDPAVVEITLNELGNCIKLTDDLFRAAARNYDHEDVMFLLLARYEAEISITTEIIWPGLPSISKVEFNQTAKPQAHNTWSKYVASTGTSAAKAFVGYWRSMNREAGDRYFNVPFRRNPNFVARDEITKIENLVLQHTVPARIVIRGLGGVGKTQIAMELAYRIQKHDPEWSIFWISSSSEKDIERSYMKIAEMLGISDVGPAEAKNSVRSYLSQKQAGKYLLIFDNADDLFPQLTEYLPPNERAQVLITSRLGDLASRLAYLVIDLSTTSVEAALGMLENFLIDKSLLSEQETTIALVQRLGLLPLAIHAAAAYINTTNIHPSRYLSLFEQYDKTMEDLKGRNYNNLIRMWQSTFEQIQHKSQLAIDYLSFIACMDPDGIPPSLLPPAELEKKMDAIGLLKSCLIITESARGYLNIHPASRRAFRNWLKTAQQFRQQVLKAANRLGDIFPSNNVANREMWREYLPHAMSLFAEVKFKEEQAKYISLMQRVGRCLFSDERYSEAVTLFETIVNIQKNKDPGNNYQLLSSMADLARTYKKEGRIEETEELELQMVKLSRRVFASEYPDILEIIRQNTALQKHKPARVSHGHSPEDRKEVLNIDDPGTLHYLTQLGLTLDREKKYGEAEIMHRIAFRGLHEVLGPQRHETLTGIFSLTFSLIAQEKREDAYDLLNEFIEHRGKSLGSDQGGSEDATYCRRQWEDYYRMRLLRKQQREQKMISSYERLQHTEVTPTITTVPSHEKFLKISAQSFIHDYPLLRAARSGHSVQKGHELEEID